MIIVSTCLYDCDELGTRVDHTTSAACNLNFGESQTVAGKYQTTNHQFPHQVCQSRLEKTTSNSNIVRSLKTQGIHQTRVNEIGELSSRCLHQLKL